MMTDVSSRAASKDNLLGICNAVGEDFGFNPLWLRLALGASFVLQPVAIVTLYFVLGAGVLISRILVRPRSAAASHMPVIAQDQAALEDEQLFAKAA